MMKNTKKLFIPAALSLAMLLSACGGPNAGNDLFSQVNNTDDRNGNVAAKDADASGNAAGSLTLNSKAVNYLGISYGEFRRRGGSEAEFIYHGVYMGSCPDVSADAAFQTDFNLDEADYEALTDDIQCFRLEGSFGAFFDQSVSDMNSDELMSKLAESYGVAMGFEESAGTSYYVSGDDEFLSVDLDVDENGSYDYHLDIAASEGVAVNGDTFTWLSRYSVTPEMTDGDDDYTSSNGDDSGYFSYDSQLGYSLYIPAELEDLLVVKSGQNDGTKYDAFYLKDGLAPGEDALVCELMMEPSAHFVETEGARDIYSNYKLYSTDRNGYAVYVGGPSDVPYNYEDETITTNYARLSHAVYSALDYAFIPLGYDDIF